MPEYDATTSTLTTETENVPYLGQLYEAGGGGLSIGRTRQFLMRGVNGGGSYVHWTVGGSPDLVARYAPEAIPDPSTITIAARW